jgi:hypothetical protein
MVHTILALTEAVLKSEGWVHPISPANSTKTMPDITLTRVSTYGTSSAGSTVFLFVYWGYSAFIPEATFTHWPFNSRLCNPHPQK